MFKKFIIFLILSLNIVNTGFSNHNDDLSEYQILKQDTENILKEIIDFSIDVHTSDYIHNNECKFPNSDRLTGYYDNNIFLIRYFESKIKKTFEKIYDFSEISEEILKENLGLKIKVISEWPIRLKQALINIYFACIKSAAITF